MNVTCSNCLRSSLRCWLRSSNDDEILFNANKSEDSCKSSIFDSENAFCANDLENNGRPLFNDTTSNLFMGEIVTGKIGQRK